MKVTAQRKQHLILMYFLGIIPFAFNISLLAFYFHAMKILGFAPSYNNPDPKELSIYRNYDLIISMTSNIWLYSLPVWIFVCLYLKFAKKYEVSTKSILISSIGHLIALFLLFSGIMEWYLD